MLGNDALWSGSAQCVLRGGPRFEDPSCDRRHHPAVGELHLRIRSVALSGG